MTEAQVSVLKKWSCGRAKLPVDVKSEAKQTPSHLSLAASLIATHGRGSGQQGKVRGPYLRHDPLTQANMAKAAAIVGPTLVERLGQTFYGYTKAVPKSTMLRGCAMVLRSLLGSFFTQLQPPALELPTKE